VARTEAISVRVPEDIKAAAQQAADRERRTLASLVENALMEYLERNTADASMGYGWEKFFKAVDLLASSPSPLPERLRDAFIYNLIHVREENVPSEVWPRLCEIRKQLTRVSPKGNEGSVEATIKKMSIDEVHRIASEIFSLHDIVTARYRQF
jgi:predicted transcriptional regulator